MTVRLYSKTKYGSSSRQLGFRLESLKKNSSRNLNTIDISSTNYWADGYFWVCLVDNNLAPPDAIDGDVMVSLRIDSVGDIVAIGYYEMAGVNNIRRGDIFKFSSSGDDLGHLKLINPQESSGYDLKLYGLAIDSSDNLYVAGQGGQLDSGGGVLVKYNSSGRNVLWQRDISTRIYDDSGYSGKPVAGNGVGSYDSENCLTTDSSGNVYMAATTGLYQTGVSTYATAFYLIKFDSSGNIVWQRVIKGNNTTNQASYAQSVVVSGTDIYLTGSSYNSSTTRNYIILSKYNTSGSLQWQKSISFSNSNLYPSNGLVVDTFGNVYITAKNNFSTTSSTISYLIKLDSSGNIIWQKSLSGKTSVVVSFQSLTIDSANNLYVCGQGGNNGLIIKYNSFGVLIWQRALAAKITAAIVEFNSIRLDAAQTKMYVCGYTNDSTYNIGVNTISSGNPTPTPGATKNNQILIKLTADGTFPEPYNADASPPIVGMDNQGLSEAGYRYTIANFVEGIRSATVSSSTLTEEDAATSGNGVTLTLLTPQSYSSTSLTIGLRISQYVNN